MITGSESDGASRGSTKDPTPSQDAPSQDAPVDDTTSSKAKAASTSSPAKNLILDEARSPQTPPRESAFSKDYHSLLDTSSDEAEEEGAITEPQEISNGLDVQQVRYRAAQLQRAPAPPTPVYPRGYYPPDAGSGSPMFLEHLKAPRGLNHRRTSRGAYERVSVQGKPLFVNDIEAARCVLLAPHRIPLKEFTSLRKKPEDRGWLFPPENTTTQSQAENLFWRWLSLKNFTVQELKELREDRLLSYVLDQRDLRIEFVHLIAKRQLHSVMEGLRQQSKSGAQDKRGYGSVNPGTIHRKAAQKPRTTDAPAVVDTRSQQPLGSQPGADLPAPTSSVTRGNPAISLAAGASQSAAALGRPTPHGRRAQRQEELSHAFEYEAPSQPFPSGPSTSGRDFVGSLFSDEVRQLRDRVYEIALGHGPGGQAATQAGKSGALEVLRQDLDALGRETHELHGRVDRRVPASALKELRRGLDPLSHEPVYQSQASTPPAPVVQRTQPRFEEVSSHLGIPPSEKEDPADRDTA
ncbi:ATP-binding cassette (ABC) Superfamily [Phytophthora palmivora]|uniref:ATP-binding cassette (ABC) Superfamily n=1 Tax=Phytophthora palmivora TaxID=4796 RepID=A0A2P4YDV9_9STRA|nr:ATP-binding cassette (ABC) Superfamily [Phytophthora palmivora]